MLYLFRIHHDAPKLLINILVLLSYVDEFCKQDGFKK